MIQYNTLNVTLPNTKIKKIKSGIKNGTEVALKLSSNVVGIFLHKLLLTNTKFSRLHKAFKNNIKLSANIKLSKTQLHKIGGLLGQLLGPLLKAGLPLM